MSIFGDLLSKIFPSNHPAVAQAQAATPTAAAPATQPAPAATPAAPPVDVEQILMDKAARSSQPLNWQTSIVDLLKLLGMDSSLSARKTLAGELHYTGDTNDSATMNIWLHQKTMEKLMNG